MANDGMCFQRLLRSRAWHGINEKQIWAIFTKCSVPTYFKEQGDTNKQRRHQPYSWWCTTSPALMIYSNTLLRTCVIQLQTNPNDIWYPEEMKFLICMHVCMYRSVCLCMHRGWRRVPGAILCHPPPYSHEARDLPEPEALALWLIQHPGGPSDPHLCSSHVHTGLPPRWLYR